ncbi:hypothetical protein [Alkalicoccobacillus murimartini]|uniref:Uncharacterized protein n=1 Tax=Alkalicoccobacillus murimartini TaxID=171685 RepID=A0ABT9YL61_9BACI|nr:hypothetical protein [Alkalicoccobacillus murimartini]MDQ0207942.1 hypothetical protein [Alkalicoccobacillus murimartini]
MCHQVESTWKQEGQGISMREQSLPSGIKAGARRKRIYQERPRYQAESAREQEREDHTKKKHPLPSQISWGARRKRIILRRSTRYQAKPAQNQAERASTKSGTLLPPKGDQRFIP